MPEDQETPTPTRRRTRRQDAAAANDSVATTTATEATEPTGATTPTPKRRSAKRAAVEQPTLPGDMAPLPDADAAPTTKPRRARATPASTAAAPSEAAPEAAVSGGDAPAPKRKSSRSRAVAAPVALADDAPAAVAPPADASNQADHDNHREAPSARRMRMPRVRHGRGEADAPDQAPAASAPTASESAPTTDTEPTPSRRGFTVWVNQEQRPGERGADMPGGAPRQPQRPHQNPAARGGQGSMPPYRPGGRGTQQRPQSPNRDQHQQHQQHQQHPGGSGEGQQRPSQYPYQPYAAYGQPGQGQSGQQGQQGQYGGGNGNRSQEQHRPPTRGGRQYGYPNYGDQQGNRGGYTDQRDMRAPRDRRPPASPASYAEQAERGGPLTTRRNPGNQGGRRGQPDTRGGRPSRDGGSMYTHSPTPAGSESRYGYGQRQPTPAAPARTVEVNGVLWLGGGQGMSPAELLDERNLLPVARINPEDVRRYGLRSGDLVSGIAEERAGRRHVVQIDSVNEAEPETQRDRPLFEQLTATFPERRIRLEQGTHPPVSTRLIDLFAPLGFGSRALVVAPPKTGKTTLIREAAEAVLTGYPNAVVMAVLVGERPEEVTDLRARLEPRGGLVYAASFDEETERHAWLVQVAVERAKRVAESGRDAFMVLDSLTRLARAENLATRGAGRTLSGGIDAQALDTGRRAFGAARNLDEGGSLTILATCLVDTGSRQDDVVYEEFKGTGNMELHLSRELSQRRLFPAVDVIKSSTRREEMLLTPEELRATTALRRRLADVPPAQATQQLLNVLERTQSNAALLQALEQSGWLTSAR